MKMTKKQLEAYFKTEVPDFVEAISAQKGLTPSPKTPASFGIQWRLIMPLLILPLLIGAIIALSTPVDIVASSVYVDFDTAIEIQVDAADRIVDLIGENAAGDGLVEYLKTQTHWENEDLEAFLETLFISALHEGYIQVNSPVMVGFTSQDPSRLASLKEKVIGKMEHMPAQARPYSDIYEGPDQPTGGSDTMPARMSHIRQEAIQWLLLEDDTLTYEALATMPAPTLIDLLLEKGYDLHRHRGPMMP